MTEENQQDQPKSQVDAQREEVADSQQEPQHDSGLQTPQPDQRMPTEVERSHTGDLPTEPQDAPEGYEPQVPLQPGQTGEMVERPGEQVSDVEEEANDRDETSADQNDDEAVDDPDSGTADS